MEDEKKMAAAISAVLHYIQTEEEIMVQQAMAAPVAPPEKAVSPGASVPLKLWAMSGRQTQMQIRHLMTMKAFHGLNVR